MKICSTCKVEQPLDSFTKNKSKKDGLSYSCKNCKRKHQRDWYNHSADAQKKRVQKRNKHYKRIITEKLLEYLLENPCVDCGEGNPIVLEFDHLRDKEREVSLLVSSSYSWARIEAEISKCQVLCANCHRKKTAEDQKWTMLELLKTRGVTG